MTYWIARGGTKQGPYTLEDAQRMLAAGSISPTDLAWKEGMPQWLPAGQVIPPAGGAPPLAPGFAPPPGPGFASPQIPLPGTPGYGYPQPGAPPMAGPIPPNLHWALVLLFGFLTGLFTMVWIFLEAGFVKKVDPRSNAIMLMVASILLPIGFVIVMGAVFIANSANAEALLPLLLLGIPVILAAITCNIMAWFSMRRSLVTYYNTVEPIGLRLSGAMTFFFNVYYFQYHFSRIAQWKTTGVLTPQ
jgi:hypothetical protein